MSIYYRSFVLLVEKFVAATVDEKLDSILESDRIPQSHKGLSQYLLFGK